MTMPFKPFSEAGLEIGDRLRFRADGSGRVVIERIEDIQPGLALPDGTRDGTALATERIDQVRSA